MFNIDNVICSLDLFGVLYVALFFLFNFLILIQYILFTTNGKQHSWNWTGLHWYGVTLLCKFIKIYQADKGFSSVSFISLSYRFSLGPIKILLDILLFIKYHSTETCTDA